MKVPQGRPFAGTAFRIVCLLLALTLGLFLLLRFTSGDDSTSAPVPADPAPAGQTSSGSGGNKGGKNRKRNKGNKIVPAGWASSCEWTPGTHNEFRAYLRRMGKKRLGRDNQSLAWAWYPYAIAMLNMYEVSGDKRYLDVFVDQYEQVIDQIDTNTDKRDEVRDRIMAAWGFPDNHLGHWSTTTAVSGTLAHAGLRFAYLAPKKYDDEAERFTAVAKAAVDEFADEYRTFNGRGYYLDPFLDLAEPINHSHTLGQAMVLLHEMEGGYGREIKGLALWFQRATWRQDDGSLAWAYRPLPGQWMHGEPEQTLKASITIRFVVDAHDMGLAFSPNNLRRIARTFLRHVDSPQGLNRHISLTRFEAPRNEAELSSITRFAHLDGVDSRVGDRIIDIVKNDCEHFQRGWATDRHSVVALTKLLARRS